MVDDGVEWVVESGDAGCKDCVVHFSPVHIWAFLPVVIQLVAMLTVVQGLAQSCVGVPNPRTHIRVPFAHEISIRQQTRASPNSDAWRYLLSVLLHASGVSLPRTLRFWPKPPNILGSTEYARLHSHTATTCAAVRILSNQLCSNLLGFFASTSSAIRSLLLC
jgi:hypothetical protein